MTKLTSGLLLGQILRCLPSMTTSRDASRLVRCTLMRDKLESLYLIVVQIAILNHLTKIELEWPDSAKVSRNIGKTRIWAISLVYELS